MERCPTIMRALRGVLDNDDVLRPLYGSIITWHNREAGTNFQFTDIAHYHFSHLLRLSRAEALERFDAYFASDDYKALRPYERAPAALRRLRSRGDALELLSAAPKHTKDGTELWCAEHFLDHLEAITILGATGNAVELKVAHALRTRRDYAVEDRADTALGYAENGIHTFVPLKPWNSELLQTVHPHLTVVKPWWHSIEGPKTMRERYVPRGLPDLVTAIDRLRQE